MPESVSRLWDKSGEALGCVPNAFRTQTLNGDQFLAWWKYFNLLVNEDDLEPMREAGLSAHEIMEAVQVIGMFNMTNRISSALGFVPNNEYYPQHGSDPASR